MSMVIIVASIAMVKTALSKAYTNSLVFIFLKKSEEMGFLNSLLAALDKLPTFNKSAKIQYPSSFIRGLMFAITIAMFAKNNFDSIDELINNAENPIKVPIIS